MATDRHVENPQAPPEPYQGYAGLPPLVGLQSMVEAVTKGLTVADSVARLKRLHWSLKRLHGIFVKRIAATPIYELKMAFSLHAHYCAEHVGEFARRVEKCASRPTGWRCAQTPRSTFFSMRYWRRRRGVVCTRSIRSGGAGCASGTHAPNH